MRILSQSLKSRFGDRVEVALYEEFQGGNVSRPVHWIVTSADREDHEWKYNTHAQAHNHYEQLREARMSRAPGRYNPPGEEKKR